MLRKLLLIAAVVACVVIDLVQSEGDYFSSSATASATASASASASASVIRTDNLNDDRILFYNENTFDKRSPSWDSFLHSTKPPRENSFYEPDDITFPDSKRKPHFGASNREETRQGRQEGEQEPPRQHEDKREQADRDGGVSNGADDDRRLCEIKYAEYISRIFPNDEEITADANESEFDGRELAAPGEYPHMTALGFEGEDGIIEYKCGGSLISDRFVITAAHCTNVTGEVPTKARIGDLNLRVAEQLVQPFIQLRNIQRIHNHPSYESHMYYNDIALLQLSTGVEFTEFVRPIRLWVRPELPFNIAFAMGYGATSFGRAPSNHLTYFNMTIVDNMRCNNDLPQTPEVPHGILESQICAQDFQMKRDTCQGDSGGPLQYNRHGRRRRQRRHYHLIGITSFGFFCRSPYPSVYTRIFSYLDWIEGIVWQA